MNAYLLVIQGPDQGQRFELAEGEIGLGRGVRNEIRIQDGEASRAHARLALREGRFVLTDLQSSNGTYVNGRRIDKQALRVGDEVQVGRTVFRLLSPEEAAKVKELVQNAVGFDAKRGDQIAVVSTRFESPAELAAPVASSRTVAAWWHDLVKWGVLAVLVLLLAFGVVRPLVKSAQPRPELSLDDPTLLTSGSMAGVPMAALSAPEPAHDLVPTSERLRLRAVESSRQDTKRAAQIIKSWLLVEE